MGTRGVWDEEKRQRECNVEGKEMEGSAQMGDDEEEERERRG